MIILYKNWLDWARLAGFRKKLYLVICYAKENYIIVICYMLQFYKFEYNLGRNLDLQ